MAPIHAYVNCSKVYQNRNNVYKTELNVFNARLEMVGGTVVERVTLTTQLTRSRFKILLRILENWPGANNMIYT